MKKKIAFLLVLLLLGVFFSRFALSQTIQYPEIPPGNIPPPPSGENNIPKYVKYLFNFTIAIGGIIALGALILAGYRYIISVGNAAARQEAKDKIISAIIGLALLLSSYLILVTINPELVVFKLHNLPPPSSPSPSPRLPLTKKVEYQEIPLGVLVERILAKNISCFEGGEYKLTTFDAPIGYLFHGRWTKSYTYNYQPEKDPENPQDLDDKKIVDCYFESGVPLKKYQRVISEDDEKGAYLCYKFDDKGNFIKGAPSDTEKKKGLRTRNGIQIWIYHDRLDCLEKVVAALEPKMKALTDEVKKLPPLFRQCSCSNCKCNGACETDPDSGACINKGCRGDCGDENGCPGPVITQINKIRKELDGDQSAELGYPTQHAKDLIKIPVDKYYEFVKDKKINIYNQVRYLFYKFLLPMQKDLENDRDILYEGENTFKKCEYNTETSLVRFLKYKEEKQKENVEVVGKPFHDSKIKKDWPILKYCRVFNCYGSDTCHEYKLNDQGRMCKREKIGKKHQQKMVEHYLSDGDPATFYCQIKAPETPLLPKPDEEEYLEEERYKLNSKLSTGEAVIMPKSKIPIGETVDETEVFAEALLEPIHRITSKIEDAIKAIYNEDNPTDECTLYEASNPKKHCKCKCPQTTCGDIHGCACCCKPGCGCGCRSSSCCSGSISPCPIRLIEKLVNRVENDYKDAFKNSFEGAPNPPKRLQYLIDGDFTHSHLKRGKWKSLSPSSQYEPGDPDRGEILTKLYISRERLAECIKGYGEAFRRRSDIKSTKLWACNVVLDKKVAGGTRTVSPEFEKMDLYYYLNDSYHQSNYKKEEDPAKNLCYPYNSALVVNGLGMSGESHGKNIRKICAGEFESGEAQNITFSKCADAVNSKQGSNGLMQNFFCLQKTLAEK